MKNSILVLLALVGGMVCAAGAAPTLEEGFLDPPKANRPQVWWWFDPTAPDAAITRDLEGLKRVGVSGFHIYGGSVTGKGWLPKAKWALHEANRLGLDGVIIMGAKGTDPICMGAKGTDPTWREGTDPCEEGVGFSGPGGSTGVSRGKWGMWREGTDPSNRPRVRKRRGHGIRERSTVRHGLDGAVCRDCGEREGEG